MPFFIIVAAVILYRNDDAGTVMKQVKAQVMSRDDSSGGWVPVAGGGMSIVALRHISTTNEDGIELTTYKITGHRQSDGFVSVLT